MAYIRDFMVHNNKLMLGNVGKQCVRFQVAPHASSMRGDSKPHKLFTKYLQAAISLRSGITHWFANCRICSAEVPLASCTRIKCCWTYRGSANDFPQIGHGYFFASWICKCLCRSYLYLYLVPQIGHTNRCVLVPLLSICPNMGFINNDCEACKEFQNRCCTPGCPEKFMVGKVCECMGRKKSGFMICEGDESGGPMWSLIMAGCPAMRNDQSDHRKNIPIGLTHCGQVMPCSIRHHDQHSFR